MVATKINECLNLAYENLQASKKWRKIFKDNMGNSMIKGDKRSIKILEALKEKYK